MGLVITLHVAGWRRGKKGSSGAGQNLDDIFAYALLRCIKRIRLLSVCLLLCGVSVPTFAQMLEEATHRAGAALTIGVTNTQFPFYADNAAGFDLAFFYQRSALLGLQLKGGSYPYSAKFSQSPITVGYRIGRRPYERNTSLWTGWNPFAYFGGGFSHAHDSGNDNEALAAVWDSCLQGSFGVDHQARSFSWRVMEISWTKTATPSRDLRTIGVSTGLVYHFKN